MNTNDRGEHPDIQAVADMLGLNLHTQRDRTIARAMVVLRQAERTVISLKTKEALVVRRSQGVRLGRPPVLSGAVVDRMRQERAAGATLQAIADGLDHDGVPTAQGGRRWHAATVRDVIRSAEWRSGDTRLSQRRSRR